MKFDISEQIMTVIPGDDCGIAEAVGDYEIIRHIPGEIKEIRLVTDGIKELDTAYFKFLLALKALAAEKKISFSLSGTSPELDYVSMLYGVDLRR